MRRALLPLILAMVCALASAGAAEHEHAVTPEKLGNVHFAVSCLPATQPAFDRATAMLHSFWYPQALNAYSEITRSDPGCAMAYWGIAISRRGNPLVGAPGPQVIQDALEAIGRARHAPAATGRERGYLAAIETYYGNPETRDYRTRVLAYEGAMASLYRRYPRDTEAAVFYALALNEAITVSPADPKFTRQLEAGAILEKVLAAHPEHPGALHYLIHSYDFPELAERGLAAARLYGDVAPSAPHALHMPSHVYSMLGMWPESIRANAAALTANPGYAHALDFTVYAQLQLGQDVAARRGVERAAELQKGQAAATSPTGAVLASYTALAAIPARYAIERGAWAEAAALEPLHQTAVADAITYFTRAMGAARGGDAAAARRNVEQLEKVEEGLRQSHDDYWAGQVAIERLAAAAWASNADGRPQDALAPMREAADREDASEKHVAMENRLWPMRELLGDLLLEAGQPGAALREYQTSLRSARNRFRGYYGAAQAAQRSGDLGEARHMYGLLVALCSQADTQRPELLAARAFLAQ